ncbi:uncharacterized protein MKK02DRAFT_42077 [Dioszegia hungarica]|uniref:Uncharacterized protein n=1 Tax=Dioszegia hungarica TaxID=4972 RepID=A0AA38HEU7_9TREE|nr:uncharacterized protein MKK02DRAFT_42077 [Dioszegia hungarica]KAI9639036.1 hypothetical protein MKK02DRAFT_42077 [Dioszegia hungarica]
MPDEYPKVRITTYYRNPWYRDSQMSEERTGCSHDLVRHLLADPMGRQASGPDQETALESTFKELVDFRLAWDGTDDTKEWTVSALLGDSVDTRLHPEITWIQVRVIPDSQTGFGHKKPICAEPYVGKEAFIFVGSGDPRDDSQRSGTYVPIDTELASALAVKDISSGRLYGRFPETLSRLAIAEAEEANKDLDVKRSMIKAGLPEDIGQSTAAYVCGKTDKVDERITRICLFAPPEPSKDGRPALFTHDRFWEYPKSRTDSDSE